MTLIFTSTKGNQTTFPRKQVNNNGVTSAKSGMPFKSQHMTQGNDFSLHRKAYNEFNTKENIEKAMKKGNMFMVNKGIAPFSSSSSYIERRKQQAIGKGSRTSNGVSMSFKNSEPYSRKTALAKARGGGSVAPKKKGAVN